MTLRKLGVLSFFLMGFCVLFASFILVSEKIETENKNHVRQAIELQTARNNLEASKINLWNEQVRRQAYKTLFAEHIE